MLNYVLSGWKTLQEEDAWRREDALALWVVIHWPYIAVIFACMLKCTCMSDLCLFNENIHLCLIFVH